MTNISEDSEKSRPSIWKTICGIDDSMFPFICGAAFSTGLSTMLEPTFELERFISGCCMLFASVCVFFWNICLSRIKRDLRENKPTDDAKILSDKKRWENYYTRKRSITMKVLIILALVFVTIWGIFLYLSYQNNAPVVQKYFLYLTECIYKH